MNKLLIGIDFGTSTNYVTKYDFNKKDAIAVANMGVYSGHNQMFDNCIYFESENTPVLGSAAHKKGISDPLNFFSDIKQFIVSDDWKHIVPNLNNKEMSAQDITERIFHEIRRKVEENEAKKIDGAVITVPYAYSDKYKKRIVEAANDAGLNVIKLVEEPVAAAISFGVFNDAIQNNEKEKIVVFDLGGGTFDITVFDFIKNDKQHAKIEVLNTDGVASLGGNHIDNIITEKFREELNVEYSEFSNDQEARNFKLDLTKNAIELKFELSDCDESDVFFQSYVNQESKVLDTDVTKEDFNDWLKNNNVLGQIEDALDRAIFDIDLEPKDIDRIVLAGGTSNIPVIKELVRNYFGKEPESKKNLGELVGHGAGILAGLSEDDSLQYEVIRKTSKNIGIAKGNKFEKILSKNIRYGEESAEKLVSLKNPASQLSVTFYEGDSTKIEDCEKVGKAQIDGTLFENAKIYIKLNRDEQSGRMKYKFSDTNGLKISSGFLEEINV